MSASTGIAGHGKAAPAERTVEVQITREVRFLAAAVDAKRLPDGNALVEIIDPGSSTVYRATVGGDAARKIGRKLMSTVPVAGADEMPTGAAK